MDKQRFRPASPWENQYFPQKFRQRLQTAQSEVNIFYVTSEDAKHLPNGTYDGKPIWITSENQIPKPKWRCAQHCLPELNLAFVK